MVRFLLILILSSVFGSIQAEPNLPHRLRLDSSSVSVRKFNDAALADYRADRDFNYGDVKIDVSPSLWDRFWRWFWNLFGDAVGNAVSGGNFKYVFITLGIAAILFAVFKLSGMDIRMIFTGRSKEISLPFEESLENIHEISFDEEISQAVNNQNYRLAVRLLYLKSLKKLSDGGRIEWRPDKTNSQYVNEIIHPAQKSSFKKLTLQFEYVWYGDFSIDKESFRRIDTSFTEFNRGQYR